MAWYSLFNCPRWDPPAVLPVGKFSGVPHAVGSASSSSGIVVRDKNPAAAAASVFHKAKSLFLVLLYFILQVLSVFCFLPRWVVAIRKKPTYFGLHRLDLSLIFPRLLAMA